MKDVQARIIAVRDALNPAYRKHKGFKTDAVDIHVSVACSGGGWWASVDCKQVYDGYLPTIEEALAALEEFAAKQTNSEDALARTLGIAS